MLKIISAFSILILITFSVLTPAQTSNSLQINGGIVFPPNSPAGFNANLQFNYSLNNNMQIYIYSGYSHWNKYNVNFTESLSAIQQITHFYTYLSDNHVLIPVFVGAKMNFAKNRIFTASTLFEVGYSHLNYDSYSVKKEVDPNTGQVLNYYTDRSTQKKVTQNLFGFGVGIELSHDFTKIFGVLLSFKLNGQLNSGSFKYLSGLGSYTSLNLGFYLKI